MAMRFDSTRDYQQASSIYLFPSTWNVSPDCPDYAIADANIGRSLAAAIASNKKAIANNKVEFTHSQHRGSRTVIVQVYTPPQYMTLYEMAAH
jgi:hypothetical protein